MSPLYAAALILNPTNRTRYIETHWPRKWSRPTLAKVKKLWEKYREEVQPLPALPLFSYDNPSKELKELDAFDEIVLSLRSVARRSSEDEYEDYNSQESYNPGKKGALAWWCQDTQRQRWPRLSLMAIDILSIPSMSDEPERVFSAARRTISWDRGQIEPETIEMRECLKHWKKSGILSAFFQSD
jgi:hAT family C-terminal dimerisation region